MGSENGKPWENDYGQSVQEAGEAGKDLQRRKDAYIWARSELSAKTFLSQLERASAELELARFLVGDRW